MKTYRLIAALGALAVIVSACEKGVKENNSWENTKIKVNIEMPDTKTAFSGTKPNYSTSWSVGDYVYVTEDFEGTLLNGNDGSQGGYPIQSDALTAATDNATFTVDFGSEAPTPAEYLEGKYKFYYFACSTYYMDVNWDADGDHMYTLNMPLNQQLLPGSTPTTPNAIDIASDLMVSRVVETSARPSELTFQFARVGTIVKINMTGLPANATLLEGHFTMGDNYLATTDIEGSNYYTPSTGKYEVTSGSQDVFFEPKEQDAISTDASGNLSILLRVFSGTLDDWFELFAEVVSGTDTVTYSKFVDLEAVSKTLAFNEGGVTEFNVAMKPAQAEDDPDISYSTYESLPTRDGFTAVWEMGDHVSDYKCYYYLDPAMDDDDNNDYDPITKISLSTEYTTVSGTTYAYVKVQSGLAAGYYNLVVRAIPDSDSGPINGGNKEVEMTIGKPIYVALTCQEVSLGSNTYYIEMPESAPYSGEGISVIAENYDFGYDAASSVKASDTTQSFYIMTADPQEFPAGLVSVEFQLGKWYDATDYDIPTVYGIKQDLSLVEIFDADGIIEDYDEGSWGVYKCYEFDLSDYVGFKLVGGGGTILQRFYLNFYK